MPSADALPPTSLIICSRDRPALLSQAVDAVLAGDTLPSEIVVVDDSVEPNRYVARRERDGLCPLTYLWTHSRGLSRANNDGIRAAQHDVLVFTQDDVHVSEGWFRTLVEALLDAGPRSVVTGRVLPREPEVKGGFAPSNNERESPAEYRGLAQADVLYVQSMALFRSAFEEVGLFDERLGPGTVYPAAEDNDLCLRLLAAGFRLRYIPEAVVYHRAWRGEGAYLPLRWNYGVARGGYYAKYLLVHDHYGARHLLLDIWVHLRAIRQELWPARRKALGDAVLILGMLYGSLRWLVGTRWMPSR